jgi:hypothetical protein
MNGEQPRYEFRVWADSLPVIRERIGALGRAEGIRESTETYFVSRLTAGVNPKARDGDLDVKVLAQTTGGFEQWRVESKVAFPVSAEVLAAVLGKLGVDPPRFTRCEYSLDHLRREVVEPHPDLEALDVVKNREFSTVARCRAELTKATVAGRSMETAAVESADPEELAEACRVLGIHDRENVSYPRILRRLLGWGDRTRDEPRR